MTSKQDATRLALASVGVALALGASGAVIAQASSPAAQIHRRVLTLDSHVDVLLPKTPPATPQAGLSQLRAGGVDAVVLAVFAPTGPPTPEGYAAARTEALAKIAAIKALVRDNPQDAELALGAADVRRIVGLGKIAVLVGFLNAYWLNGDVAEFDKLYAQGVRVAGLAHAGNNAFADSSRPQAGAGEPNGGLSEAGKAAVQRLNDLGVLVDVSQLTPKGVFQTLQISRAPVVATHSDVRALVDATRNLSDVEIDAIAKQGGVIQVTPFNAYLVTRPAGYEAKVAALRQQYGLAPASGDQGLATLDAAKQAAFMDAYRALYPRASLKQYVDHIDYIAKRVGVDHVGIGSDFNHGAGITGFADESEAPNVTRELVARGYTEPQIAQIWGGNFLRVLAAAEAAKR
ncbi:membrane dipeptidase [Phenylobacterium sp.]|uniref:dipeptidase n=1 Tax=Phenylobacterium sp. TaxID=1871053 RepID=UPI0012031FF5|nr:membrane dipeptidase [Phenylobacterium sp.]THD54143.1 MAG: membrane dipeptidase [Phenylobacterium sp.]